MKTRLRKKESPVILYLFSFIAITSNPSNEILLEVEKTLIHSLMMISIMQFEGHKIKS